MQPISKIGIVGAGTMGSALAQKFAQEGFQVILADREEQFVNRGIAHIQQSLDEAQAKKVLSPEKALMAMGNITGASNLEGLKDCGLVIEAIFENFEAKCELFRNLSQVLPSGSIIATNTSSYSVTELSKSVSGPERFIGLHFFYHAAKNRLVEIIRGAKTSNSTFDATYRCMVKSGKDPIICEDAYGFVVNRFFVPWLNEAVRIKEEGIASAAVVDFVCAQAFGIGMGPFALMNATGVPVAYHAQKTLEVFGNLYKVSPLLKEQAELNRHWEIEHSENMEVSPAVVAKITERMMGTVFFICAQLIAEKVCSLTDLNKGAKIGLKWRKGPAEMMQQMGMDDVKLLIANMSARYNDELPAQVEKLFLPLEHITLKKVGDTAVIKFNRPEDLNALNEETMAQLDEKFTEAQASPNIKNIVLTGSGKAFVAGADIKFFVRNMRSNNLDNIVSFTRYGQEVFDKIDKSEKNVVAVLNGMALGGGLELALCADQILAVPTAVMAFPETGIGIYPGLGGTFRARQKLGKGLAKYLILTGKTLNAKEAFGLGLVDNLITVDQMLDITGDGGPLPQKATVREEGAWKNIAHLFDHNNYESLLKGINLDGQIDQAEFEKISKTIGFKAPVAMKVAEELIENGTSPASELEQLRLVFSTEDAMTGLSSIGKRVEYKGK